MRLAFSIVTNEQILNELDPDGFPLSPLLTIPDLARLLKLTETSVRRIIDAGQGPRVYRVGGSIRVNPIDLRDWVLSGDAAKARTSRGYKSASK